MVYTVVEFILFLEAIQCNYKTLPFMVSYGGRFIMSWKGYRGGEGIVTSPS